MPYLQTYMAGVVLAGGYSTRMGKDKVSLVGSDGRGLLQKNIDLLREFFANVWVSCRKDSPVKNHPCVFDTYENVGPLGGIHASLEHAHSLKLSAVMVVACDMPNLSQTVLQNIIDARNEAIHRQGELAHAPIKVTAYCEESTRFFQGLCAIWEVSAREQMLKDMTGQAKERRLWNIAPPACQNLVMYKESVLGNVFTNLNTPNELEEYLRANSENS